MILDEIIDVISISRSISVLPHISADGDALGSGLALALALSRTNKNVAVYLEENIPRLYSFLPGQEMVEVFPESVEIPDTAIAIDTGDIERLGKRIELFKKANNRINIDHHYTNTKFADLNYVCVNSSAVGEIIYQIINMMGFSLDKDISTCLYVAITTVTGGFRYENTTYKTHLIASDLLKSGINIQEISSKVFDSISKEKVKLTGAAISSLELLEDERIAFITVTERMMEETGALEEECEGIINLGRNIYGVEIAALFREKQGEVKVSFRSNSDVDVSTIANRYSGGGHKKAAGCTIKGTLHEVKKKILNDMSDILKR
ncbi:MAG TPA: bifunctional oligoribonuclease/PAP phosphatase NrnA [Clostridiales bacterium]|nr:bifunctional oligoribonuclease/PAP phosphatase NrnA [Clostridiales bacterium]